MRAWLRCASGRAIQRRRARKRTQALKLAPSVDAYLVLGRLDLAANHMDDASKDIGEALKLDPGSRPAQELNRQIEARTGRKQ